MFVEFLLETIRDALYDLEATEQVGVQVTEQVEKLLRIMGNEPISGNEIMKLLDLKHRPTFRNNYLLPAIDAGFVEMTIPEKPNSSKQKYRKVKR